MKPLYVSGSRFKAGENIPDWLITCIPENAESSKANITFSYDVIVVEIGDIYYVLPCSVSNLSTNPFKIKGGKYSIVRSIEKIVARSTNWTVYNPPSVTKTKSEYASSLLDRFLVRMKK